MSSLLGKRNAEHDENWANMFKKRSDPVNGSSEIYTNFSDHLTCHINRTQTNPYSSDKTLLQTQPIIDKQGHSSFKFLKCDFLPVLQNPKHATIIPYEERKENYYRRRAEIFKDFTPVVSKKVAKARKGHARRKKERKEIASASIETGNDIRPYMDVKLNGLEFKGLLDSGASESPNIRFQFHDKNCRRQ